MSLSTILTYQRNEPGGRSVSARTHRVPTISRFLRIHWNRLGPPFPCVSFTKPLVLRSCSTACFFACSSISAFNFPWMHRVVFGIAPCGLLLVIFQRQRARRRRRRGGPTNTEKRGAASLAPRFVRPDTFYRAVNAGCGGLVRSTELFYGRRQIYRASLFPFFLFFVQLQQASRLRALWHDRPCSCAKARSSIPNAFSDRLESPGQHTADLCSFNPPC